MNSSGPLLKDQQYKDNDVDTTETDVESKPYIRLELPATMKNNPHSRFALHLLLLLGYTSCFLWLTRSVPKTSKNTPAREALVYEKHTFYSPVDDNPFAGPPRPELDAAWHDLLKSTGTIFNKDIRVKVLALTINLDIDMHIRISREEMDKLGGRSLELTDGSGYAGSLEVYHDLHCLKRLRHFIYRETYLPNMTEAELEKHTFHTEHCLEHFRELVMCRGDIALTTFLYRGGKKTAKLLAEHDCINWNKLENWVMDRAIDLSVPGIVLPVEDSEQFEQT